VLLGDVLGAPQLKITNIFDQVYLTKVELSLQFNYCRTYMVFTVLEFFHPIFLMHLGFLTEPSCTY